MILSRLFTRAAWLIHIYAPRQCPTCGKIFTRGTAWQALGMDPVCSRECFMDRITGLHLPAPEKDRS